MADEQYAKKKNVLVLYNWSHDERTALVFDNESKKNSYHGSLIGKVECVNGKH